MATGTDFICNAWATCGWASISTTPSNQAFLSAISSFPKLSKISFACALLTDQASKITTNSLDLATKSDTKFSWVTCLPWVGATTSPVGFFKVDRSKAFAKLAPPIPGIGLFVLID